jgi:16S rRNA (guanine1207-N2)-methyltransferase
MHLAPADRADPALATLMLPFAEGLLDWPADGRVLFLHARAGAALHGIGGPEWQAVQPFKPDADRLSRIGMPVLPEPAPAGSHALVLLLPPRQRTEARASMARALGLAEPGGVVVASLANNEGARSAEADLARLAGAVESRSGNKCRVFWVRVRAAAIDAALLEEWAAGDRPRPLAGEGLLGRPGVFSWDRIDPASRLLGDCLPPDLAGRGADLGAGAGYLALRVLASCPGVTALDLYEADARALDLARANLAHGRVASAPVPLAFHWHDVTTGVPRRHDFVVCNPPFHDRRSGNPALGQAFIGAAAGALLADGRLWLVANRHLPYEATLARHFGAVRKIAEQDGFKVFEAREPRS